MNQLNNIIEEKNDSSISALVEQSQKGCLKSRNTLISKNYAFIHSVARKYYGLCNSIIEIDDLVNESFLWFIHAVNKYDNKKGASLLSYSSVWIRSGLTEYLIKFSRSYNIPLDLGKKLNALNKSLQPDDTDNSKCKALCQRDIEFDNKANELELIFEATSTGFSLSKEEQIEALDDLESKMFPQMNQHKSDIRAVYLKYGLLGKGQTLQEIGVEFDVSKQRAHALVKNGLNNIRAQLNTN